MPIGAHDQQIGAKIRGARQQHLADRQTGRDRALDLGLDAMPRQMQRDICAGQLAMPIAAPRADRSSER